MNELQVFNNPELGAVPIIMIKGEPFFVGKDIAQILGYTNTPKAIRYLTTEILEDLMKAPEPLIRALTELKKSTKSKGSHIRGSRLKSDFLTYRKVYNF